MVSEADDFGVDNHERRHFARCAAEQRVYKLDKSLYSVYLRSRYLIYLTTGQEPDFCRFGQAAGPVY